MYIFFHLVSLHPVDENVYKVSFLAIVVPEKRAKPEELIQKYTVNCKN